MLCRKAASALASAGVAAALAVASTQTNGADDSAVDLPAGLAVGELEQVADKTLPKPVTSVVVDQVNVFTLVTARGDVMDGTGELYAKGAGRLGNLQPEELGCWMGCWSVGPDPVFLVLVFKDATCNDMSQLQQTSSKSPLKVI